MKTNKKLLLWVLFLVAVNNNVSSTPDTINQVETAEITHEPITTCQSTEAATTTNSLEATQLIQQVHTELSQDPELEEDLVVSTLEDEKNDNAIEIVHSDTSDCITICNAITDQSKEYTCKWGTFTPDTFSVRLIIDFEPNQTLSIPKQLIEKGKVQAEYSFAFNKGIASRKGTRAQVLTATEPDLKQDLFFSWDEPRFQLQANTGA